MSNQTNAAFTFNASAMHKAIEDYVLSARACEEADSKRVTFLKVVGHDLAAALGKAGRADGFHAATEIMLVKQAIQAEMPAHLAQSYKDKQWEVIRAAAESEGQSFKVINDKASQVAAKRDQAVKDQAAVVLAAVGKPIEQATATELLALQTKPEFSKLTPTAQNHIVTAYQKKRGEELAAQKKAAAEAEKAQREALREEAKSLHGKNLETVCEVAKLLATWDAKRLAKVMSTLAKIK